MKYVSKHTHTLEGGSPYCKLEGKPPTWKITNLYGQTKKEREKKMVLTVRREKTKKNTNSSSGVDHHTGHQVTFTTNFQFRYYYFFFWHFKMKAKTERRRETRATTSDYTRRGVYSPPPVDLVSWWNR